MFTSFDSPQYAKIAANFPCAGYGDPRTLLSYEARTQATDESVSGVPAYWALVSPGVGIVMRPTLSVIAEETAKSSVRLGSATRVLPGQTRASVWVLSGG